MWSHSRGPSKNLVCTPPIDDGTLSFDGGVIIRGTMTEMTSPGGSVRVSDQNTRESLTSALAASC